MCDELFFRGVGDMLTMMQNFGFVEPYILYLGWLRDILVDAGCFSEQHGCILIDDFASESMVMDV